MIALKSVHWCTLAMFQWRHFCQSSGTLSTLGIYGLITVLMRIVMIVPNQSLCHLFKTRKLFTSADFSLQCIFFNPSKYLSNILISKITYKCKILARISSIFHVSRMFVGPYFDARVDIYSDATARCLTHIHTREGAHMDALGRSAAS